MARSSAPRVVKQRISPNRARTDFDLDTLVALSEEQAIKVGGHLRLLRFSTGWKAMFGTPDLHGGRGYDQVLALESHATPQEAIRSLLRD